MRLAPRAAASALACAFVAITLAGAASGDSSRTPFFFAFRNAAAPGSPASVSLDLDDLPDGVAPGRITITAPAGYTLRVPPSGTLEIAYLSIWGTPITGADEGRTHEGPLVLADPASVAASVQACSPGTHVATFLASLDGIPDPVAVTLDVVGGRSTLTFCLDAFRAAGLVPDSFYITGDLLLGQPATPATYVWSALLTPTDAAGSLDPDRTYELRADDPFPHRITARATYSRKTHRLSVRGVLSVGARTGRRTVLIAGGPNAGASKLIGHITTHADGSYAWSRAMRNPPPFVDTGTEAALRACSGSTAPGGCPSESEAAAVSPSILVRRS